MKIKNKYAGCMIGGAIGDAMGYPIEFSSIDTIKYSYGKNGIEDLILEGDIALVSDDTQMSMFTAQALLNAKTTGKDFIECIKDEYKNWFLTQTSSYNEKEKHSSKLMNEPGMYSRRAPGCSCMSAIELGANGTIKNPINNSKGCGGVMRIAPIGLFIKDTNQSAVLAAKASALTHGHPLGYILSYFIAYIINLVSHSDVHLSDAVLYAEQAVKREFLNCEYTDYFLSLIDKAIELSTKNSDDVESIKTLGEGWVAEETAAIAIYCSLKYNNNFEKAILSSVNHSGDSDSTGAVTGNVLGAYLGVDSINKNYLDVIEHKNLILELSEKLYMYNYEK